MKFWKNFGVLVGKFYKILNLEENLVEIEKLKISQIFFILSEILIF